MIGAIKRALSGEARARRQREQLRKQSDAFGRIYFRGSRRRKRILGADGRFRPAKRIAPMHSNWWTRLRQRVRIENIIATDRRVRDAR